MSIFFRIKRIFPTSLYGRALLILILPVVILQLTMAYIFYERHWQAVVRTLSNAAAANIVLLVNEYERLRILEGDARALEHTAQLAAAMGLRVSSTPMAAGRFHDGNSKKKFPEFYQHLDHEIDVPIKLRQSTNHKAVEVAILLHGQVVSFTFDRKRLASSTTYIFILWMVGTALILLAIAVLFLRNQIRPIVQLARAAEQFGLGRDAQGYSPRGASEVRRAGRAFLTMAERVRRAVASRTEMLAGISHDLRTPLTRMKLEIEMAVLDARTREALSGDIEEMRHMIDEYLDFARGDAGELAESVAVAPFLAEIVESYARQGRDVTLVPGENISLMLRPKALRRALQNVIDNALRYGRKATLATDVSTAFFRIKIRDEGAGIPEASQQDVFKPFLRLDPSRNSKTGGVGLGLSIARDIAQSHGGDVTLENIRQAGGQIIGLEVTIRLPRQLVR
jgi:two-component system osmolarity sensor histidine kinase EnvZ